MVREKQPSFHARAASLRSDSFGNNKHACLSGLGGKENANKKKAAANLFLLIWVREKKGGDSQKIARITTTGSFFRLNKSASLGGMLKRCFVMV